MLQKIGIGDLRLKGGAVLLGVELSYMAFGKLSPDGRNAILVTHGFTSGPGMLVKNADSAEGSWADLVGPGAPLDTDRYFIICSNMLGSAFGSTGPASINPATGQQYGPDFPDLTLEDIVAAQHAMLVQLGVLHLKAVVGPSYGGLQALQWANDHPDMVEAIGVVVSGPRFPPRLSAERLLETFSGDPNWNGGWYYDNGGIRDTMTGLRIQTLNNYGMATALRDQGFDPAACEQIIWTMAEKWSRQFDANAMLSLCKAAVKFDATDRVPDITARMLWVVCTTDQLFPPDPAVVAMLKKSRAQVAPVYVELDSRYGHIASGIDHPKWSSHLRDLIEG